MRISPIGPVLVLLLTVHASASEPQPPTDPVLRAEVEALVKDLGAREYKKREAAAGRLLRIGDDAVWLLVKAAESPDSEVQLRAREILDEIAWVPPEERARIDGLIRELAACRDPVEAGKLFAQIEKAGKAAVKALVGLYPSRKPDSEAFTIVAVFGKRTGRLGEAMACRATMTNGSDQGAWINTKGFSIHKGLTEGDILNNRRPQKPLFTSGGGTTQNTLVHLAPGASLDVELSLATDSLLPGRFEATVHYASSGAGPRTTAPAEPRPSGLPAWVATDLAASAPAVPLALVPAEVGPKEGDPFALQVALPQTEAGAGGPVAFSWEIQGNLPQDVKKGVTATMTRWALLMDAKGEPVAMAALEPAAESEGKSGAGSVTPPGPGSYTLVVGCSRRSPTAHVPKFDVVSKPVPVIIR